MIRIATPAALILLPCSSAHAFGIFGNSGLDGGYRWDAAPLTLGGRERSLNGGLRYSLQGGSFQAFRDLFAWQGGAPSVANFQTAVENAFDAWTIVDPATGIGSDISFTADLATAASTTVVSGVRQGAEIDLFGAIDGGNWNPGGTGTQGETAFSAAGFGTVTLTSGTTDYSALSLSGADITFNSNPGALYSLTGFQLLLSHEIGHAIGFGDVDFPPGAGSFIDDNYDSTNGTTAAATLTNSFSRLIDTADPSASLLSLYTVANGNPGVDSTGVDILMESAVPSILGTTPNPLRNDDFAGRQFLYPADVPDPGDTDLDGDVDLNDLSALALNYGVSGTATWFMGNFDQDNDVDLSDLSSLAAYYGTGQAQAVTDFYELTGIAVPEPSGSILLLSATAIATRIRQRPAWPAA